MGFVLRWQKLRLFKALSVTCKIIQYILLNLSTELHFQRSEPFLLVTLTIILTSTHPFFDCINMYSCAAQGSDVYVSYNRRRFVLSQQHPHAAFRQALLENNSSHWVEGTPGAFMVLFYPQEERFYFCLNHLSLSFTHSFLFPLFLSFFTTFSPSCIYCDWIRIKRIIK